MNNVTYFLQNTFSVNLTLAPPFFLDVYLLRITARRVLVFNLEHEVC